MIGLEFVATFGFNNFVETRYNWRSLGSEYKCTCYSGIMLFWYDHIALNIGCILGIVELNELNWTVF